MIVAHSIGASITTGLLAANGIPDKLSLLVTYGASCRGVEPHVADLPMLWLDFAADRDPFAGASPRGSVRMNICNERSAISDHWAIGGTRKSSCSPYFRLSLTLSSARLSSPAKTISDG